MKNTTNKQTNKQQKHNKNTQTIIQEHSVWPSQLNRKK